MSLLKFSRFFTNFFKAKDQGQSIPSYSYNFFSLEAYTKVVVVFPQAPFRVTNVPRQASAGIIQLRNCTLAP